MAGIRSSIKLPMGTRYATQAEQDASRAERDNPSSNRRRAPRGLARAVMAAMSGSPGLTGVTGGGN